jgi:hypothetical protein
MWMRISATNSEARRVGPVLAWALAGAILAGGCLFTPRPAPPPCDPRTDPDCRVIVPPKTPLSPDLVLANIKSGLQQRVVDPHIKNSLSDDFVYKVDPVAQGLFPNFSFDPWDKGREVRFLQKVLESETRPDSVTFFVPPGGFFETERLSDDKRRYSIDYKWTLVFRDSTQTSGKRRDVYHTLANWDFVGVSTNNVKLQQWEDKSPPNSADHSSGFLRAGSGVVLLRRP